MRILAIETSTRIGSVALAQDDALVAESTAVVQGGHASFLLPAIDGLLAGAGWKISDINLIACAVGPGSFAGLRVGISTAKGIAFSTGAQTMGLNTLEAMAWPFGSAEKRLCPVLDAKKNQIYAALFIGDGKGSIKRLSEDLAEAPEKLLERIEMETLVFGDGVEKYSALIREKIGNLALFVPHEMCYHKAGSIAALALEKIRCGAPKTGLFPNYVRPPDVAENKPDFERSRDGDS